MLDTAFFCKEISMRFTDDSPQGLEIQLHTNRAPHREPVKIILLGSRAGVNSIVHLLHHLRFAEVFEWTDALKAPDSLAVEPREIMRLAIKYLPETPQG
ncbi:MAG: hypothetical protein ACOYME_02090 [Prochlorotrichaceae cyanobacterium]